MNGDRAFAQSYARTLMAAGAGQISGVQPFVIPPLTAIGALAEVLGGSGILIGAQNAHWAEHGAWTGEVSMAQVADAGAQIVEVGHSERREYFGETDRDVNLKVKAAIELGLTPLVCVGESDAVFRAGDTVSFITAQVDSALDGIVDASTVLLAYEPIWAIGEHGRTPEQVDLMATFCSLSQHYGDRVQAILYGGSVNPHNNQELLGIPGVDGLFIGRSAWTAQGFLTNLKLASETTV